MRNAAGLMRHTAKQSGFTLTEIALALLLLGIIATFTIPTLMTLSSGTQRQQLSKNMFTVIGEAHLARRTATDQFPLTWSTAEQRSFAQYLYTHLNYVNAIDPASVALDSTFCGTAQNYFTLSNNIRIRQICYDNPDTTPNTLRVVFEVPQVADPNTSTTFEVYLPENQDRYTTKFGFTGTTGDCTALDRWVGTCGEAANPCPAACPTL